MIASKQHTLYVHSLPSYEYLLEFSTLHSSLQVLTTLTSFSIDCDFSTIILFITNAHYSHSLSNLLTSWPISVFITLRRIVFIEVVVNCFFSLPTSSLLLK